MATEHLISDLFLAQPVIVCVLNVANSVHDIV